MKNRVLSIALAVVLLTMIFPVIPATASVQGLSLSEIQNKEGVYIKQEDRFYKIAMHGANVISTVALELARYSTTYEIFIDGNSNEYWEFMPDDQLVYVGSAPSFHSLSSLGFTAKNYVAYNHSYYNDLWGGYTHINGVDITNNSQLREQHYFKVETGHSNVYGWLLVGNEGQELTLGKWEKTSWIENKVVTDKEFFRIGSKIDYTTTQTYDGYFIINFNYRPSGRIYINDNIYSGVMKISEPIDSASTWAKTGIVGAISKGFVPTDIQSNYTNFITRAEFCRMAVRWVEYATGKNIDTILAERNLVRNPHAFTDTDNIDILAAYALGITNGTGNNTFTPLGQFTREQAATMIMNTCKVIGANVNNPPDSSFGDLNTASDWAINGINFVRANGIMQGVGDNKFSPKSTYTIQESIITFNNINLLILPNS